MAAMLPDGELQTRIGQIIPIPDARQVQAIAHQGSARGKDFLPVV
ncbi:MAG: hypothetical protein ACRD1L_01035 [Terriglobales bacterium]